MSKMMADQFEVDENNKLIRYINKEEIEIVIPDYITDIGNYALMDCNKLISVTILEGVTCIGENAFSGCISLKNINIPESVTIINDCAFASCKSLTSVTIPNSVVYMGYHAFDSRYIKDINIYSYKVFTLLDDMLKAIAITSTIKNYSTGKIKYSEKDMLLFEKYIIENKQELLKFGISNTSLLNYMLNEIGEKFITYEEAQNLLNLETENKAEKNSLLLEYLDKNYREEIEKKRKNILDELSLDDLDKLSGLGEK